MAGRVAEPEPEPAGAETPRLALPGFHGPLDRLLVLARAQQIDLAGLPVAALVDQLAAALQQAGRRTPLGQQGDWVVMAAWLLLLRSQLLLPADTPAQQAAAAAAGALQTRLRALQATQALAGWLDRRPQLGRDVFARGRPEPAGGPADAPPADIVAFLWASLALFHDPNQSADAAAGGRPPRLKLYAVAAARARILRCLAETAGAAPFAYCLPAPPAAAESAARRALRRRSAWASTLVAGLELTRQGAVAVAQGRAFGPIHLATAQRDPSAPAAVTLPADPRSRLPTPDDAG